MSVHVHVRLNDGYAVTEDGQLLERTSCHCGASWETFFQVDEGEPENI
ncbi:hypothetical protein OHB01_00970 [Microbispora hainanensis]|jgi:hypothetical protein|uniref:Uncharacterized protein n=1 Tax=Microbispora hainanensis TaxID=568844 RepID=A0ABZ1SRK4_9ACTN|nr:MULTISPECIES: hypothetical protein [Microbispora]NJP26191.1 hypothetical protein [Microbispora sp. CL1-1]